MFKIKSLFAVLLLTVATGSSAKNWPTQPANVVENCQWQYHATHSGFGFYAVEYRSVGQCAYHTKLYDYRAGAIRYF